jgi:class 3 adenylate cyclase
MSPESTPETRYAVNRGVHIAYQALGEGPPDLGFVAGLISHCEHQWEEPALARSLRRMARFSRLIWLDKRGTGLSDPVPLSDTPILEQQMEDLAAVLDSVGSERTALFAASDAGPMCILFAATYPERVSALVLYGTWARLLAAPDYPAGMPPEAFEQIVEMAKAGWGTAAVLPILAPSAADDTRFRTWWARWERLGASPGTAAALMRIAFAADVRALLPTLRVPTLVLHRAGDQFAAVVHGRYLADHIPGARYVELPGRDHPHFVGDTDAVLTEVEEFVTGRAAQHDEDRILATMLFTDIVDSTRRAATMGDKRWTDLLQSHHDVVRRQLERFRGVEVDTAGDGFLVRFDGPARAIRCACAVRDAMAELGLQIRAGLHTGEIQLTDDKVSGLAVHIGARVAALAQPGEVLVSQTVKDLVTGSGLPLTDRGVHELKGVPEAWRVFLVAA